MASKMMEADQAPDVSRLQSALSLFLSRGRETLGIISNVELGVYILTVLLHRSN